MPLRILVLDDHPFVHEIMRAVLARAFDGPEVLCAADLPEAIERARAAKLLDLAVLDLGLPGCSGIEALTRFRKAFPGVPAVVFSANEDADVIRAARDAGARGYLLKTAKPAVLQAALALVAAGETFFPSEALAQRHRPKGKPGSLRARGRRLAS
ncbi:MAG: response regulator transcription factor [Pseudomonadota bacterium]